jgi:alkylhydroperoxidase/carboxymuconolactone decarboxylase family protein YurZ
VVDFRATLRRLTVRDDEFVDAVLVSEAANRAASLLDQKTHALVRMGALIAIDAPPQSYAACVDTARDAGALDEEIAGVLVATLAVVGAPRVASAAPKLGLALGYDLDAALEHSGSP